MNRRLMGALTAGVLLCVAGLARAQSSLPAPVVFTAVDAVKLEYSKLSITGIVEGEAAPRTVAFYFASTHFRQESCERLVLLAMEKPGQYLLTMQNQTYSSSDANCSLSRANP